MAAMTAAATAAKSTSPWWGPVAAGGLAALGSIGSSAFGMKSASNQRKFQERMSNTAHRREMTDLEKAGLNPLLTGKYGGSSTPSGTQFTPENPLKGAVETALATKRNKLELGQIYQNTMTASALENKAQADAGLAAQRELSEAETTKLLQLQQNEAKSLSDLYKNMGSGGKGIEKYLPLILKIFGTK